MSPIWLLPLALSAAQTQRSVLADLERVDKALATAEARLRRNEAQRTGLQKELARTETDLAVAVVRKREAFEQFRRRVQALDRMPAGARLVLLGGSRTLADYLQTARVLRWVAGHDRRLHDSYVDEATRLENLESSLVARRQELEKIEIGLRATRDELAASRQERIDLLKDVLTTTATAARAANERSAARRTLADMVRKLSPAGRQSRSFAGNRGRLPWPTLGKVDVAFGQQIEREFGTVTAHNGIDIRAPSGSRVQAVAGGNVAFADWLRGYGRLVIIDHGEGYHTLYAHLGAVTVARGEVIEQGKEIGAVGDTGSLRGTLLYFEIRAKSVPVNPARWLR